MVDELLHRGDIHDESGLHPTTNCGRKHRSCDANDPVHKADSNDDLSLFLDMPDLEGLEFLLDEIEDQIAPLA